MDLKGKVRQGMRIFGAGDRDYGTVERFDDDHVYVGGRRIPASAFERLEGDRLYVGESGARHFAETGSRGAAAEARVPVVEERLDVEKRPAEVGAVEIHKRVETEQVSVPVELTREEVNVRQVDVEARPLRPDEEAFEERTIRVPVRGEEAVTHKRAVVTDEVVVDKERATERQEVRGTVRKERVEVDDNYQAARAGFQEHFQRSGRTGRTWEQAEPSYRHGFEAGHHERYAGREFDEVEPDLRRDWESTRTGDGGDAWQHLREEVREGWNRARRR